MPLAQHKISKNRQNFEGPLNLRDVKSLANDHELRVLQTSSPVDADTWLLLNDELFSYRKNIELRVYGFNSSVCDLSFLPLLKNVRHFSADCLIRATGLDYLSELTELESLSIGIYDLDSFSFLQDISASKIQKLSLCLTKSKKPKIHAIERFIHLKSLYLEGQSNGVEAISSLPNLVNLTLRSITLKNLDFIRPLSKLISLDIKLGGITNLAALANMDSIRYLEIWQVKGLSDLSAISSLAGMQYLFLQSLKNVIEIPDLSNAISLRRLYLENMKGLKDLSNVSRAPALEEFIHASAAGKEPVDYEEILNMPSLKSAAVWFGSDRKNIAFRELAAKRGIDEYKHQTFTFNNR